MPQVEERGSAEPNACLVHGGGGGTLLTLEPLHLSPPLPS